MSKQPKGVLPDKQVRISVDTEALSRGFAALGENLTRMQMDMRARTVFSMAYRSELNGAREVLSSLDPERRAKVVAAARAIVAMDEEG